MRRVEIRAVRRGLAHRAGLARPTLVLVVMWIIGLSALGAVFILEQRYQARSRAQVLTAELRKEVSDLLPVAFSGDQGLSHAQVEVQLRVTENRIAANAAQLGRLVGHGSVSAEVMSPALRLFALLDRASLLASTGHPAAASAMMGEAASPGGPDFELTGLFTRFSREYDREAAQAKTLVELGALFAVIGVLVAFSVAFHLASKLAREKHDLLEKSREEALTDPLTGLANRRRLFADMAELLRRERAPGETLALGMFDLDGFKIYNDTFGHPAGDALLARLGMRLRIAIEGKATAYRMGGDEFCVIAHDPGAEATLAAAQSALSEESNGFTVRCSSGSIVIAPTQITLEQALRQADQRLYSNKRASRTREGGEAHDVLLRVLVEHSHSLATHVSNVGRLAEAVARKLGLSEDEVILTRLTAELHDIGKTAIPNAILDKAGPLDDEEWVFIKRHTIIGERILAAAPALARVAPLVRSTHERADGAGYPDGLRADEIPLSSSIVAVVDAYDAMTSRRAYGLPLSSDQAIAELRRCAGSQFDESVTEAFAAVLHESAEELPVQDPSTPAGVAA